MYKIFTYLLLFLFFAVPKAFAIEETLILFDSTMSMANKLYDTPKYQIAAEEAKKVLDAFPSSKPIGLRIIGVTLDANMANYLKNPKELCMATKLLVPINTNNTQHVKNSLETLFPLGTTPLEYSLSTAIKYDFSHASELKHIILVTDGAEGCNGNPCKFIKEIMQNRKDIKIDIVAIGVNSSDFDQLKCLSDSTSGVIMTCNTPKEIGDAFKTFLKSDIKSPGIQSSMQNSVIYKNILLEFQQ